MKVKLVEILCDPLRSYGNQQGGIIFLLAEITGSGALLILCELASRHKKSMEKAAAEG